jgi:hypothetical protein
LAFYRALDAGGTKTEYVLADDNRELARVRGGTIKRMRTDANTAMQNLGVGDQWNRNPLNGAVAKALVQIAFSAILFTNFSTLNIRKWPKTRYPNRLHFAVYIGIFTICTRTFYGTRRGLDGYDVLRWVARRLKSTLAIDISNTYGRFEVPRTERSNHVISCLIKELFLFG